MNGVPPQPFAQRVAAFQAQLGAISRQPPWYKRVGGRNPSPELRRVCALMFGQAGELQRLVERAGQAAAGPPLPALSAVTGLDILTAWVNFDGLKMQLLDHADDAYLAVLVDKHAAQLRLMSVWQPPDPAHPVAGSELDRLIRAFMAGTVTDQDRHKARTALRALYLADSQRGNLERARQETRRHYLARWNQVLAPLIVLLGLAAYGASRHAGSGWRLLVAALAGALGSTLSGVFAVRGSTKITALRSLRALLFTQVLVGATASLFLYAFLESRVLQVPGTAATGPTPWAVVALYGFLAGFSEPFFLGLVRRVASGVSSGDGPDAPPPAPGAS